MTDFIRVLDFPTMEISPRLDKTALDHTEQEWPQRVSWKIESGRRDAIDSIRSTAFPNRPAFLGNHPNGHDLNAEKAKNRRRRKIRKAEREERQRESDSNTRKTVRTTPKKAC